MKREIRSQVNRKKRMDKLDSALLFLISSIGLLFALVQVVVKPPTSLLFIIPVFIFGWALPFYYGYVIGAIKRDSLIDRYRGWTLLVNGLAMYALVIGAEIIILLPGPILPIAYVGFVAFAVGVGRKGRGGLRELIFSSEMPSPVVLNASDWAGDAALIVALNGGIFLVFVPVTFLNITQIEYLLSYIVVMVVLTVYCLFRSEHFARWGNLKLPYTIEVRPLRKRGLILTSVVVGAGYGVSLAQTGLPLLVADTIRILTAASLFILLWLLFDHRRRILPLSDTGSRSVTATQ